MPYVTSSGTTAPRSWGLSIRIRGFGAGIGVIGYEDAGFAEGLRGLPTHRIEYDYCRPGDLRGAQINSVHNVSRSAAVSAVPIAGGVSYGAG
jgi:hypothetical protein